MVVASLPYLKGPILEFVREGTDAAECSVSGIRLQAVQYTPTCKQMEIYGERERERESN